MFIQFLTVWSPYTKSDIATLEMVQLKAAHYVFNDFSLYSCVSSMLSQLNWQSLEERRTNSIITMAIQYCQALFVIQLTSLKTVKQYQTLQRRLEVKYYFIVSNQKDSMLHDL